ncbi:MAG TPA: tRNA (adenine-N1)-methyltransferase [Candidatus Dormibacteraeota bacterium]
MELSAGDSVILHDRAGRRYHATLQPGAIVSLHSGVVQHDDLIGLEEGSVVSTHQGARLLVLRPTFSESILDRRRRTQPIYPKDLGAILVQADIHPGARVLEAGAGTGTLTAALLRAVGPTGAVVAYEMREDFLEAARASVAEHLGGAPANLELRLGDVYADAVDGEFDRVCLDLPEPWQALPQVAPALRPGGVLFALSPNVSQVQRLCDALREVGGFGLIETVELLERAWTVRGRSLRPAHRMVAHTAFLTFARRLAGSEVFETESEGF